MTAPKDVAVTGETPDVQKPVAKAAPVNDAVAYVGTSHVRAIYAADWERIGIDGKDRVWSEANRFEIPVADMTAAEIELLAGESDFAIRPSTPVPEAE